MDEDQAQSLRHEIMDLHARIDATCRQQGGECEIIVTTPVLRQLTNIASRMLGATDTIFPAESRIAVNEAEPYLEKLLEALKKSRG